MAKQFSVHKIADVRILPGFDGDPAGGGAGAAAGGSVTLDQVKEIVNSTVNSTVNNAIANLKKTDMPKLFETHLTPITAQLTGFSESLKTLIDGHGTGGNGNGVAAGAGAAAAAAGAAAAAAGGTAATPEVNYQLKQLNEIVKKQGETIDALKTGKEAAERKAEETDRHSIIRTALGQLQFVSEKAADTAFSIVVPKIKRQDDGVLISDDNLTVDSFVKDFLPREHAYLLKATGASGSGASMTGVGVLKGGKTDMSIIKPGMSAEQRAAVLADIAAALPTR